MLQIAVQQIRRIRGCRHRTLFLCTTAFVPCLDSSGLHRPGHAVLAASKASIYKVPHYAWGAVYAITEPANFRRALKRWTGKSPSDYR
ncbi:hypothetical protein Hsc_1476 [Herbaspirillum seropedicae]|nr:hypothetical protein Hsc_1476 [Herbaspirillum seropedicae]